jgi:hypothetical protein
MPTRRCRSRVPTGLPVLPVRLAVERPCLDGFRTSPCPAVSRCETSCPADFRERHQNSLADAVRNAPQGSARILPGTAIHSIPGHATRAYAAPACHPWADAARCARPEDCFPDRLASCSSLAAEDYWSVQPRRHSSRAAAHDSLLDERFPLAEPSSRAERARELDPMRFPAHAESSATESVARSCRRMVSVLQPQFPHD